MSLASAQADYDLQQHPACFSPEPVTNPADAIRDRITAAEQAATRAGAVIELDRLTWNSEHECFQAEALLWDFRDPETLGRAMLAMGTELLRKRTRA